MNKSKGIDSKKTPLLQKAYLYLAARPYTVILLAALAYSVCTKFFWACKLQLKGEFHLWILSDIAVFLGIEVVFALICFFRPRRNTVRLVTFITALVCTWSVINAGWLRRTGTQVLPSVMLPLFRAPSDAFGIIGGGLGLMPASAVLILGTSAVLLLFFFSVIAKPVLPRYKPKRFALRIVFTCTLIAAATTARVLTRDQNSLQTVAQGLKFNCLSKAFVSLFAHNPSQLKRADFAKATRRLPRRDEITIEPAANSAPFRHNVVIVVLEGIQYRYTSLGDPNADRTPFIASIANEAIDFADARCTMTHTTKALFALHTGRVPSLSQDIAEAVPVSKPYASIATILHDAFGYRTAYFQTAKGEFECRPGLVHNLGFEKFWARNDCQDANAFVGYLGCDEFALLEPIRQWITSAEKPFLLTIMCSVSHDPYKVPRWFEESAKDPFESYLQTIRYTDSFLAELDIELTNLGLADNTIFCIVGDHGEAFGEHGLWAHERIAFEEVLRIVMVMRAPGLVAGPVRVTQPVSSIDFAPTLLALAGLDVEYMGFDGINALADIPADRKVYFAGWLDQSPAGYVQQNRKYFYDAAGRSACLFNLSTDPLELAAIPLPQEQAEQLQLELAAWKRHSLFKPEKPNGKIWLFDNWKCRWSGRIASASFRPYAKK
jgi:phosphoglycerol transferase MdoB-like AlkP superfamily enzyme